MNERGKRKRPLEALLTMSGAWGLLAAALLFALLLTLLFPEAVLDNRVFISPDSVAPTGFADYVKSRGLERALWNPFIFAGMPSYASLSYNPGLYPVNAMLRFGIDHLAFPRLSWLHRVARSGGDRRLRTRQQGHDPLLDPLGPALH